NQPNAGDTALVDYTIDFFGSQLALPLLDNTKGDQAYLTQLTTRSMDLQIAEPSVVSTFAGLAGVPGSADGTATAARFSTPYGLAVDTAGNVYVADWGNSNIRKVTPAGVVSTLAGLAGAPGSTDGTGSAARFAGPDGLALDGVGNLYVADGV